MNRQNIQKHSLFIGLCWWSLLICQASLGQISRSTQPKYAASRIPEALSQGADAVMREDYNTFSIQNIGKGYFETSYAITILNEAGDDFARFVVAYDKLSKINHMRAAIYDAQGKFVKMLKKKDIKDYSSADGFSLYTDNRIKYAQLVHNRYPYTIKFEYGKTYDGLLFYRGWQPQSSRKMAVEHSTFTVKTPKGFDFRYKELNLPKTDQPNAVDGLYKWQVKNLSPVKPETYSKNISYPTLLLAPNQFEIEGYQGNMKTWRSFGQWMNLLNKQRDEITPETLQKLKKLTAEAKKPTEKIKKVYEYLQQNTRYVSIQLGIGGWQPFKALTVDQKGYGDCKALTNYTYAMLKALGISSYYTLVRAGAQAKPIQVDFPSSQFNHVILCVPNAQDTVWLECTSQRESFGYLGSFTGDRDVLMITPAGGKIIHTPVYNESTNTLHRTAKVVVNALGNATAQINTVYRAIQSENMAWLKNQKPVQQQEWLYENIAIPSFEIESYQLGLKKGRLPMSSAKLQLKIRKLASKSGKRLFLRPNLMNQLQSVPARTTTRKNDIYIPSTRSYTDIDSIQYLIPEKFHAEYKPASVKFNSAFGSYEMRITMQAGKITYVRKLVIKAGTFPKEKYNEMLRFYKKIAKADKEMIVLVSDT